MNLLIEHKGETRSEPAGGLAPYCNARHRQAVPSLEQDLAGGALKDRSPCEVESQCMCLPNQERVAE